MNPWLYYLLAVSMVLACGACWLANLFSLPGNWALLAVVAAFWYFVPTESTTSARGVYAGTVIALAALALVGEIVEFATGAAGAARVGASRRSIWLSLVGAVVGSLAGAGVGAPIPIVGSLVAALAGGSVGAFAGAYLGEMSSQRTHQQRMAVGKGAVIGRLWGTVGKFAVGAVMLAVAGVDILFA